MARYESIANDGIKRGGWRKVGTGLSFNDETVFEMQFPLIKVKIEGSAGFNF